ncbi:DUF835 domain-containing protein [Halomicrobium salinisoli]|uniref:DUF835 domain-containing protein n=1 Tax=Halomicrobium salinisoli TaxID=2878391 RepID=UPI001CF0712D|nr:DUF835 domain-containing protein [Halomicrobium salinisoli]
MSQAARSYDLPPPLLEASHVLVESSPIGPYRYDVCADLCSAQGPPSDVLIVTYRGLRPERLVPDRLVSDRDLGDGGEASDASRSSSERRSDGAPSVDVIAVRPDDPSDAVRDRLADLPVDASVDAVDPSASLTRLGVLVDKHLRQYDDAADPVVCFDSITPLILYSDVDRAHRFLNSLRDLVDEAGGHAHYHFDPDAHDESVRQRLRTLFDAAVTVDDDGDIATVDRRPDWPA